MATGTNSRGRTCGHCHGTRRTATGLPCSCSGGAAPARTTPQTASDLRRVAAQAAAESALNPYERAARREKSAAMAEHILATLDRDGRLSRLAPTEYADEVDAIADGIDHHFSDEAWGQLAREAGQRQASDVTKYVVARTLRGIAKARREMPADPFEGL